MGKWWLERGAHYLERKNWYTVYTSPPDHWRNPPEQILTPDFSPNGIVLATASSDRTAKLWSTRMWHWLQGNQLYCIWEQPTRFGIHQKFLKSQPMVISTFSIVPCGTSVSQSLSFQGSRWTKLLSRLDTR